MGDLAKLLLRPESQYFQILLCGINGVSVNDSSKTVPISYRHLSERVILAYLSFFQLAF
jgi:hypothetical protein